VPVLCWDSSPYAGIRLLAAPCPDTPGDLNMHGKSWGTTLMRRTIAVLLENAEAALQRVVGSFAHRHSHIETLTVPPTEDETLSRLTVTTQGDESKIEQITKQLNKLI